MLNDCLRALACSALLAAGHVTVRFSWSGAPIRYIGPEGTEIDFDDIVPEDLGSERVAEIRNRLTDRGADLGHRPSPPERTGVELYGVLHGIQDGEGDDHDALVLEAGILMVPISLKEAMRGTMTDLPIRERIQHLLDQSPAELIARDDTWFLDADDLRSGTFWSKKDTWIFRLLVDWVDEDGDAREGEARIVGRQPCTPPQQAREMLEALLGSRFAVSDEKI